MTIENLRTWVDTDLHHTKVQTVGEFQLISNSEAANGVIGKYKILVYTSDNQYSIIAIEYKDRGYLGCVSQSRKSRPGEDWFRGNDLPDGPLTKKTWNAILTAMIRYELKDIAKPVQHVDSAPALGSTQG